MLKRVLTVSLCLLALTLTGAAQTKKSAMKKSPAGPAPDKAYLQKIWDGWATLDPANTAKFYATGAAHFFRHRAAEVQQLGRIREGCQRRARRVQEREVHGK